MPKNRRLRMSPPTTRLRGAVGRKVAASFVTLLAAGATLSVVSAPASNAAGPALQKITVKAYAGILANSKHHALYLLSNEAGAKIHCKSSCLNYWPPLLVKKSITNLSIGSGVAGHIGFVKRSATMKQVTFNGYPIYFFSGDGGPNQVNGQGIVADGGTWYLVRATAKLPSTTKMTGAASAGATTTTVYSSGY